MRTYELEWERGTRGHLQRLRNYVRGHEEDVKVVRTSMHRILSDTCLATIECRDVTVAERVRRFVWDMNGGAFCGISNESLWRED